MLAKILQSEKGDGHNTGLRVRLVIMCRQTDPFEQSQNHKFHNRNLKKRERIKSLESERRTPFLLH